MSVAGINSRKEVICAEGRSDLIVEMLGKRYVFEFKLAKAKAQEEKLLEEATEQCNDKHYGEIIPLKELTRIAVVINAEDKAISQWRIVD